MPKKEHFDFNSALVLIRLGKTVSREKWSDKQLTVSLRRGTRIVVYLNGVLFEEKFLTSEDILANDWYLVH